VVGIVIVAHSAQLAESLAVLTKQMLRKDVPIEAVGGIEDPENPFGTDPVQIKNAIESVYSSDGVVVLMDLGSALLNAEMSLEFLAEDKRKNIRLCAAPLVEGAITAAVQSEAGGSLDQVVHEACGALSAKSEQLNIPPQEVPVEIAYEIEAPSKEIRLTVRNPLGIHARPAAKFVSIASGFHSEIKVRNLTRNTHLVSAKSINSITTLGARQGHEIQIMAKGKDARNAITALKLLVESGFDEIRGIDSEPVIYEKTRAKEGELSGVPVSPGIAVGPAVHYRFSIEHIPEYRIEDPDNEWQRLEKAMQMVKNEIRAHRRRVEAYVGEYEASIFDAHLLSLEDPALIEMVKQKIFMQSMNAEAAWKRAVDDVRKSYSEVEDEYLRNRAGDLEDLKAQVLRPITGTVAGTLQLSEPSVLVASDINPSDVIRLDPEKVIGICTAFGVPASHSAVLVRALGIPAVFGVGPEILAIEDKSLLALDGKSGRVVINPKKMESFKKKHARWLKEQKAILALSKEPAITTDGRRVEIVANINSTSEARIALRNGAEGVGVFRTEFLFLDRLNPPSEEEQTSAYEAVAQVMGNRPLIIRTLDVGGDKLLHYLDLAHESNPFLGERGIRIYFKHPEIFKTQLKAILRASFHHNVKVMFPMVSTVDEVLWAKCLLNEVQAELQKRNISFDGGVQMGIMIEVPSAVSLAERLATEVDFFSIGTNDLVQYVMAADRTNPCVSSLNDALHPAVLRMVQQTIRAGHEAGIWVGLCGELAGDPLSTPVLIGLGIDELSMSCHYIPVIKKSISKISVKEAEKIANKTLSMSSAIEVRKYIRKAL